jgi:two-component system, OmpR family, KDP operon response regulator KdpE
MSQVGTILVVEDDVRLRRYLATLLEGAGYRVAEAGLAAGALAQLTLHPPDVVVLDLGLPDRDGLEVTRRVREWSAVPILVVSVRERDNDKIEALDSGATTT